MEGNCTSSAGCHGAVVLLVCLHIGAKIEFAVFGVADFHAGHNGTGAPQAENCSARKC
jgi:hypothetical protein